MVKAQTTPITTVESVAKASLTTPVGKLIQKAYLQLEKTLPKMGEKDQQIMTSALGGLRKVMKIKFAKKTKAKTKGTGSSTPAPTPVVKDAPGSEKLKEAYLTMAKAQTMIKKDQKKLNLVKTILDPLTRLAKAKCTMRDGEAPKKWKSTILGCAMYVKDLLAQIADGPLFATKKEKSSIQHSAKMVDVLVNKLSAS